MHPNVYRDGEPEEAGDPSNPAPPTTLPRKLRRGGSAPGGVVDYLNYTVSEMGELDDHGWAPIHHAAQKGLLPALEKFATVNKQLLELRTG